MKVYDIISEEQSVQEAPVGLAKRAGQAIAGKVSKTQARKGEVSKEANEVFKELKVQFQGSDFDLNNLPVDRFVAFMDKKGYGDGIEQEIEKFTDAGDPESTINKKQIETIVLKQIQNAAASDSRTQKGKFAGGKSKQKAAKGTSQDLKKIAQAVKGLSDEEKAQLGKMI